MGNGKIALFFTFVLCLGGCAAPAPYMDLTQPIYLVTDDSFFADCEADPGGPAACEEKRIGEVEKGVNSWFKHFDEPTRPQAIVVASRDDVPANAKNTPIHLRVETGVCGKNAVACYDYGRGPEPAIVFVSHEKDSLFPIMVAHEFGHALWFDHSDVPKGRRSVMTSTPSAYVVPLDITILCQIHDECPPHEDTWCEGTFYDPCRCPSSSFEEGEAMRAAGEIVCE